MQSTSSGQSNALAEAQRAHDEHKIEFEKLRADVSVKLRFLNENRVKVSIPLNDRQDFLCPISLITVDNFFYTGDA